MDEFFENSFICMATVIEQKIYGDRNNAKIAALLVEQKLRNIETKMSFFLMDSELSKLNAAAGVNKIKLSEDTFYVVKKAKEYTKLCNGAFDITSAPLIKLWGVFTSNEKVPSKEEIASVLSLINYNDIKLNENESSAMLARKSQMLDLGGIAKGYAADIAIEIYKKCGIESAYINLGGNVKVLGSKPVKDGKTTWNVGLQNPFKKRNEICGIISVTDKTVVTSGNYERYFESNNKQYCHILNPKTGYPVDSEIASASIITDSSIKADALSTALFVLGFAKGIMFLESIPNTSAIFITKDRNIFVTNGAEDCFTLTNTSDFKVI